MSASSVQAFLTAIEEDSTLQEDVAKAMESENDRQAVTDLAIAKGYEFSSDELWAEIKKRQEELQERQGSGELSDEELESIAGGELLVATAIGSAVGSAATIIAAKGIKW